MAFSAPVCGFRVVLCHALCPVKVVCPKHQSQQLVSREPYNIILANILEFESGRCTASRGFRRMRLLKSRLFMYCVILWHLVAIFVFKSTSLVLYIYLLKKWVKLQLLRNVNYITLVYLVNYLLMSNMVVIHYVQISGQIFNFD